MVSLGVRTTAAALLLTAVAMLGAASTTYATRPETLGRMRQEDLQYIVRKLGPHLAVSGSYEVAAFHRFAKRTVAEAAKPMPRWQFLRLADKLTNYFHDPHTFIYPDTGSLTMIPLSFTWVQGGIAVTPLPGAPRAVRGRDRLVRLGRLTPSAIDRLLPRFFSGNRYWLRYFAAQQLDYGYLLHWLGAVGPGGLVPVTLRTPKGRTLRLHLSLSPAGEEAYLGAALAQEQFVDRFRAPQGLALPVSPPWTWEVTPRYGVFWLTQCIDTPAYERAVDDFFRQVAAKHAKVVVLDLQENGGGYVAAVFPWLHHLPNTAQLDNVLGDTAPRAQVPPIFRGRLYVLQSWSSFSAAVVIDALLTQSAHAVSVGQPTGWSTGGWADVKESRTPLLHIPFQVSTQNYPSTDGVALPAALRPSIAVPLTIEDVQQGENPVASWLQTLNPGR